MIERPSCPVCGESRWRTIGTRGYRLSDIVSLNEYEQMRYRVLFEVWFPGQSEIELTSRLCRECGFVTYTPRPSADDVEAKYLFLSDINNTDRSPALSTRDPERARLLYRSLRRHLPDGRRARVLDFGGGDGRLMREFLKTMCFCYLVDYSKKACSGIERLGSTEDDIPGDVNFDLIICSHVIEHVADPLQVLTKLKGHLNPNGAIYVELPMEIWGAAPLHNEPVTHVNFFTVGSTRRLFERTGLVPSRAG